MTLYNRGQYIYSNVLIYAEKERATLFGKTCKTCLNRLCKKCDKNEAYKVDYITNTIVHKLYYSLYKIAKSYLVDDIDAPVSHHWDNHANTFLKMLKKSKSTAQEKEKCALIITDFIVQIKELRDYRNSSDYVFFDFYKNLHKSINAAISAYNLFSQIQKYLGEPRC